MIFKLKFHPYHQVLFFSCCIALTALFCYLLDFQPRLRIDLLLALLSSAIGIGIAIIALGIFYLQRRFLGQRFGAAVKKIGAISKNLSPGLIVAAALISATGEELLLRGFVFNYIASLSIIGAFTANAFIAYLIYFARSTGHTLALVKVIEATVLAVLFWNTRSVLAIAVARLISELVICFSLRSQRILTRLCGTSLKGTAYDAR